MNGLRFDVWTRWLVGCVTSRRAALRWLGGAVLVAVGGFGVREVAACKDLGRPCKRTDQCCVGACKREKCRCLPGDLQVGAVCCPFGQACEGGGGGCEAGERCAVLGGGAFICKANGTLQPGDPCDPEQPDQCSSNVCGCNGELCACREPSCLQKGANCKTGGSLACCQGVCVIRRDGRQTCAGGPD